MKGIRSFFVGLLLVAGSAFAQLPPGIKMPTLYYNPGLMMSPEVQKDMNLSPGVSDKISKALMQEGMKMAPVMMSLFTGKKMTAQEQVKMGKDMLAAFDSMQKETLVYLNPQQKARLHQITLQSTGAQAFSDPKVCKELGLSAIQQKTLQSKLSQIQKANAPDLGSLMGGGNKGGQPDMNGMMTRAKAMAEKQKKAKAESDVAVNSILTPAQKAKWKAMQGKPIKLGGMMGMGGMGGFGG